MRENALSWLLNRDLKLCQIHRRQILSDQKPNYVCTMYLLREVNQLSTSVFSRCSVRDRKSDCYELAK